MNNKRRIATPWIGCAVRFCVVLLFRAIPHNSKCRYDERGAADARPKAQIILDAAKVSAASGGNSEPKQGQRSQSARGFCPRSTMRVPQPDIIEHFGNADAVPQPPERCLSRKAGIVRCCLRLSHGWSCLLLRPNSQKQHSNHCCRQLPEYGQSARLTFLFLHCTSSSWKDQSPG